jgi:CubicO group peptidase (beta-lactamase class C family)
MNNKHSAVSIAILFAALTSVAQPAPPGSKADEQALIGLWGIEQTFGPAIGGELTIEIHTPRWRARIAGIEAEVWQEDDQVNFVLPGTAGKFRGRLSKDRRRIVGHWIQPGGAYPYNQPYATPVELTATRAQSWRGNVAPLEQKISFYVLIQRAPDGTLSAFVRNPEANLFRRRFYKVEVNGYTVRFSRDSDQLTGSYDHQADELTLPLLDSHPPLTLTRRNRKNAVGFYPRRDEDAYVYTKPKTENDGWATASLTDVDLDTRPIAALIEKILTADRSADTLNIQALLIARHGKLVLEEYFYGFNKDRPHDMRSASKTYAPVLAGIARDGGAKIGPDTPAYSLFPEYKPFANWDERKNRLKLRDLMTMTPGLACDDGDESSPGQEDRMQSQTEQPDWYKYTLDLPMKREPGGDQAIYCSASINLVGGAVRNATRTWLPEYFYKHLAAPLEIRSYHMNLMPTGEAYSGGGLYMRPRDQLKLGQLYLAGGVWNGKRIISRQWVEESVARRATFVSKTDIDHGYGYAWHVRDLKVGHRSFRDYFLGGNGGQNVIVIPDLDIVIGFTGGSYGEPNKFFRWERELVPQYIIPAAVRGQVR